ncbi:MAG: DUF1553 domain-containing protein [Candidatus Solibacter usitatus]|nr:DUF1553 domain-containing protein [Candidatus Solibacter usitatus]
MWLLLAVCVGVVQAETPPAVARLLNEKCAKCHSAAMKLSDFDITTRESLLKGGKNGVALVPGSASKSRLYQWVSEGKMPPGEKVDAASVKAVHDWIEAGADWAGLQTRKFWAFVPPVKSPPPAGDGNPIDGFLLAKLRQNGLSFSPQADHRTLIRRLYFDLTGLPPQPEDYKVSYRDAVERLLESPRYGERWGRHWLDVVRFGETDGGEHNFERRNAWRYRDWVIESLNHDKPYNQFIREQIAGDVLSPEDPKLAAATGFLVAGPWDSVSAVLNKDETLREQARMDELDDMVTTTAHSFLALTVNCARCHDHKFDPIPTRDYYQLTAFFRGVGFGEREAATKQEREARDAYLRPLNRAVNDLKKKIASMEDPVRNRLLIERYQRQDAQTAKEPKRLPINPLYNRNAFAETTASKYRLVISNQAGKLPKLDYLELAPAGYRITNWTSQQAATPDKPLFIDIAFDKPTAVREMRWASDLAHGVKEGTITVYRLEALADDGWRVLAASMDHTSGVEVALPAVSDEEVEALLHAAAKQEIARCKKELAELQRQIGGAPQVATIYGAKPKELEKAWLLERGNVKRRVEELAPGILSAVGGSMAASANTSDGERRLALANWIASRENALTARVIVNRVWYHHFGNGIVNTPSDFGINGDRPSHPELLDSLAVSFMENGWSLKWLHRQILMTDAYRQSTAMNQAAYAKDAGNRLLWRMPLKRMDAETLRDSILQITGNINLKMGGPGFELQRNAAKGSYIYKTLDNDGPEVWRRAVYRFVVRGGERIMMDNFDCPDPSVATPQRAASNTPVQALTLLNNEFVVRQAGLLAARLDREAPASAKDRVSLAYRLLYGREPDSRELQRDLRFLSQQPAGAWSRALLNSNEFVYVP